MALKRIAAGTLVSSHFVAFNASSGTTQSTTVTFSNPVLGIVFMNGSSAWAASDSLGLSGGPPVFALPAATGETTTFSGDQASPNSSFAAPGDFARIITAGSPTVPEPGSLDTVVKVGYIHENCRVWLPNDT